MQGLYKLLLGFGKNIVFFYKSFFIIVYVLLAGCSSSFLGEKEDDIILHGKRERVLFNHEELESNTTVALKLSKLTSNSQWQQTSFNLSNNLNNFEGNSKPQYVTRLSIGAGSSNNGTLTAPPIIADGVLYAVDARAKVSAYDISQGYKKIFSVQLQFKNENIEEGYGGGLAYHKGNLIVTTGYGVVYNLDAKNGQQKWYNYLKRPIRSHPKIFNNNVFVLDTDNTLHNISLKTGDHKWRYEGIPGTTGVLSSSQVAVANNTIFIPLNTGEVVALDMDGKTIKWSVALIDYNNANTADTRINEVSDTVVLHKGKMFASSNSGFLGAFDMKTGEQIWSLPIKSISAPTVIGNYIVSSSFEGELLAVNINSAKIKWILPLNDSADDANVRWLRPLMIDNKLVVISTQGVILTIDPELGSIIKRYELNEDVFISPVIADNTLYVMTDDAEVFILK